MRNKLFKSFITAILFVCLSFALVACETSAVTVEITAPTTMKVGESITLTANVKLNGELTTDEQYIVAWSAVKKSGEGTIFTLTGSSLKANGEGVVTVTATVGEKTESKDITISGFSKQIQADEFIDKYEDLLEKTVEDIVLDDAALITTALAELNALASDVKALLSEELAKLNSFNTQVGLLTAAQDYRDSIEDILELELTTVSPNDAELIEAALVEFDALSEAVQALLSAEHAHLVALLDEISAAQAVSAFRLTHNVILSLEVTSFHPVNHKNATQAAVTAFNQLSAAAKAKLTAEKTKLDGFMDKIADNEFTTKYSAILSLVVGTVEIANKTTINAAIEEYNNLSSGAKVLLEQKKDLLLTLLDEATRLEGLANTFKTTYATTLEIALDSITADNHNEKKVQIQAAIDAFIALEERVKTALTSEKSTLDDLLAACVAFEKVVVTLDNTIQNVEYNGEAHKIDFTGIISGGDAASELTYNDFTIVYYVGNSEDGSEIEQANIKDVGTYVAVITLDHADYQLTAPVEISLNINQTSAIINAQKTQYVEVEPADGGDPTAFTEEAIVAYTLTGYQGAAVVVEWFSDIECKEEDVVEFSKEKDDTFYARLSIDNPNVSAAPVVVTVVVYTPDTDEGAQEAAQNLADAIDGLVEYFLGDTTISTPDGSVTLSNIIVFYNVLAAGLGGTFVDSLGTSYKVEEFIDGIKEGSLLDDENALALKNFLDLLAISFSGLSYDVGAKLEHHDELEVVLLTTGATFVYLILDAPDAVISEIAFTLPLWFQSIVGIYDFVDNLYPTLSAGQIELFNEIARFLAAAASKPSAYEAIGELLEENASDIGSIRYLAEFLVFFDYVNSQQSALSGSGYANALVEIRQSFNDLSEEAVAAGSLAIGIDLAVGFPELITFLEEQMPNLIDVLGVKDVADLSSVAEQFQSLYAAYFGNGSSIGPLGEDARAILDLLMDTQVEYVLTTYKFLITNATDIVAILTFMVNPDLTNIVGIALNIIALDTAFDELQNTAPVTAAVVDLFVGEVTGMTLTDILAMLKFAVAHGTLIGQLDSLNNLTSLVALSGDISSASTDFASLSLEAQGFINSMLATSLSPLGATSLGELLNALDFLATNGDYIQTIADFMKSPDLSDIQDFYSAVSTLKTNYVFIEELPEATLVDRILTTALGDTTALGTILASINEDALEFLYEQSSNLTAVSGLSTVLPDDLPAYLVTHGAEIAKFKAAFALLDQNAVTALTLLVGTDISTVLGALDAGLPTIAAGLAVSYVIGAEETAFAGFKAVVALIEEPTGVVLALEALVEYHKAFSLLFDNTNYSFTLSDSITVTIDDGVAKEDAQDEYNTLKGLFDTLKSLEDDLPDDPGVGTYIITAKAILEAFQEAIEAIDDGTEG